jgi:rare lipoprotein A
VKVRVNDRGPFVKDREIDITHAAAKELGMIGSGVENLEMTIENEN